MRQVRVILCTLVAVGALLLSQAGRDIRAAGGDEKGKKPSLSLKVTPNVAIAPAKIRVTAEFKGGADDYEDFYCPMIEWDWDDETRSESTKDCEPYAPGKSVITRRFSADHTYQESGMFKATLRIKRKDKVVALATATVQVQPGLSGR